MRCARGCPENPPFARFFLNFSTGHFNPSNPLGSVQGAVGCIFHFTGLPSDARFTAGGTCKKTRKPCKPPENPWFAGLAGGLQARVFWSCRGGGGFLVRWSGKPANPPANPAKRWVFWLAHSSHCTPLALLHHGGRRWELLQCMAGGWQ